MSVRAKTTWEVYRPVTAGDGSGGQAVIMTKVADERGDVRELIARDIPVLGRQIGGNARQSAAEHTHNGYFRLRADIRRNDELRRDGVTLQVVGTHRQFPPGTPALRIAATSIEGGG